MTGRIGRDEARNLMLEYARDNNRDDGTRAITNLASSARLNLIVDQNASMAKAVGDYERMYSSVNKKLFPYVIYHASVGSRTPRSEHQRYDGMIFEKDDPWLKTHWPPWDFNCHCRLENCTDKKAHKTPDLIQPPTPADKVTVDTRSGYSFDPAHAFEKFDYSAIKDPDLQDKAKSGVEKILSEPGPAPAPVPRPVPVPDPKPVQEPPPVKEPIKLPEPVTNDPDNDQKVEKPVEPQPVQQTEPDQKEELKPQFLNTPDPEKSESEQEKEPENHEHHLARRQEQLARAKQNRVAREAKLIGADLIKGEHTREQDLSAVNPNYGKGEEWGKNCQRVVYTYEARRRGIDIEAESRFLTGSDPMEAHWKEICKGMQWKQPNQITPHGTKLAIDKAMIGFGDGSRAVVYVEWKGVTPRQAHVFIAENVGGKIVYVDPQNNDDNVDSNFWAAIPEKTEFARLDNLKFSNYIKLCCKRRNP